MKTRNQGFTLVELAVALVVFGVVMMASYQLFIQVNDQTIKSQRAVEANLGALVAERLVRKDLMDASASLNNVIAEDDSGKAFYDYRPDWPCKTDCERTLSLTAGGAKDSVAILANQSELLSPQMYPPVAAYETVANNNLQLAGTLVFKGVNYMDRLVNITDTDPRPTHFGLSPLWAPDKRPRLLHFYSPVPGRPPAALGVPVNMDVSPRNTMYLGKLTYNIASNKPVSVAMVSTNLDGTINNNHPLRPGMNMNDGIDPFSIATDGFDRFLRTLPPVGGVGAVALFRPVKLIRYRMIKNGSKGELWRFEWDIANNKWADTGTLMSAEVFGLILRRRSISSPIIDYVVAKDEAAFNRAKLRD